jgi:hypothetical protein
VWVQCRYTLQYTYPYAYYMESGPRKKLVSNITTNPSPSLVVGTFSFPLVFSLDSVYCALLLGVTFETVNLVVLKEP